MHEQIDNIPFFLLDVELFNVNLFLLDFVFYCMPFQGICSFHLICSTYWHKVIYIIFLYYCFNDICRIYGDFYVHYCQFLSTFPPFYFPLPSPFLDQINKTGGFEQFYWPAQRARFDFIDCSLVVLYFIDFFLSACFWFTLPFFFKVEAEVIDLRSSFFSNISIKYYKYTPTYHFSSTPQILIYFHFHSVQSSFWSLFDFFLIHDLFRSVLFIFQI